MAHPISLSLDFMTLFLFVLWIFGRRREKGGVA